jgi:hypothetical protein
LFRALYEKEISCSSELPGGLMNPVLLEDHEIILLNPMNSPLYPISLIVYKK